MKLPKKIKVGSTEYRVELCKTHPEKGVAASHHYMEERIVIATHSNTDEKPFSKPYVFDSYIHELTHAVLHEMNHSLARNERFVTEFASLMAKALYRS